MSIVTINGRDYEKASSLARKYRYTNDYIGQLCRAKKVDSELIGRTWYVNEESLIGHKKGRYLRTLSNEKIEIIDPEIKLSRVQVNSVNTKKLAKSDSFNNDNSRVKNFSKRIDWKPVRYEVDERALIPEIGSETAKNIDISLVDSTKVKIKKLSSTTFLTSDELPEVSMGGTILVSALKENDEVEDNFKDSFEYSEPQLVSKNTFTPKSIQKRSNREVIEIKVQSGYSSILTIVALTAILVFTVFSEVEVSADVWSYETKFHFSSDNFLANISKTP